VESSLNSFISTIHDLDVFKRAYKVSLDVHRVSLNFPKIEQYGGLADQMRRASKSICANLAEGFGKQRSSYAEFKRFIAMAIGSADEMQIWISYCRDLDYLNPEIAHMWQDEYLQIARMLQGLYSKLKTSF
jgi:four helix bundle protein